MARLIHRDGYTLDGTFAAQAGLPSVTFKYRYADPEAVFEYQSRSGRALSGSEQMQAACTLLFPKEGQPLVTSWDIEQESADGTWASAPCSESTLRKVPVPIINFLCNVVCRYTAAQQETDVKN